MNSLTSSIMLGLVILQLAIGGFAVYVALRRHLRGDVGGARLLGAAGLYAVGGLGLLQGRARLNDETPWWLAAAWTVAYVFLVFAASRLAESVVHDDEQR